MNPPIASCRLPRSPSAWARNFPKVSLASLRNDSLCEPSTSLERDLKVSLNFSRAASSNWRCSSKFFRAASSDASAAALAFSSASNRARKPSTSAWSFSCCWRKPAAVASDSTARFLVRSQLTTPPTTSPASSISHSLVIIFHLRFAAGSWALQKTKLYNSQFILCLRVPDRLARSHTTCKRTRAWDQKGGSESAPRLPESFPKQDQGLFPFATLKRSGCSSGNKESNARDPVSIVGAPPARIRKAANSCRLLSASVGARSCNRSTQPAGRSPASKGRRISRDREDRSGRSGLPSRCRRNRAQSAPQI